MLHETRTAAGGGQRQTLLLFQALLLTVRGGLLTAVPRCWLLVRRPAGNWEKRTVVGYARKQHERQPTGHSSPCPVAARRVAGYGSTFGYWGGGRIDRHTASVPRTKGRLLALRTLRYSSTVPSKWQTGLCHSMYQTGPGEWGGEAMVWT